MHESVMQFGRAHLSSEDVRGKRVLEVGALDVNGSLRGHVLALEPATYIGTDFQPGAGVDVVCDAGDLSTRFGAGSFDVVISTEMLEHAQDWRAAIRAMKDVLVPNGSLILTARGPGMFLHGYPFDWHRFTVEDMRQIFADFEIEALSADPQAPGVLLHARKANPWTPCDLVAIHVAAADEINAPRPAPLAASAERPRICLTMIVKNEAPIIARCLTKARRLFDQWVIVDTGSSDRTMEIIRETLADVPGRLIEHAWKGFGDAKTTAIAHAQEIMGSRGYALVLDADEIIDGDLPHDLTHAAYSLWMQLNNVRYRNARLFRLDRTWRYEGVLHEFPSTDGPWTAEPLAATITSPRDGARGKEADRYQRDAEALVAALEVEDPASPLAARYTFYLAQSYRDAGDDARALTHYQKRSTMGGGSNWEEIYVSKLESARCLERLGQKPLAERMYLDASHTWPDRAEALRSIKRIIDDRLRGAEAKQPVGALFVEVAGADLNEGFFPIIAADREDHEAFFAGSVEALRTYCLPYREEYAAWPEDRSYNGWFEAGDLELYYAVLRTLRPKRILEIGSGHAAKTAVDACTRNGHGQILCVDPDLRSDLPDEVQILKMPIEDVPREIFDDLESGDLLFIDSSHTAEETLYHCLLLDRLPQGVVVHHHDCMYPRPPLFPEETLLMHYYRLRQSAWRGIVSNAIARQAIGPDEYGNLIPAYRRNTARFPGSIYTRKRER